MMAATQQNIGNQQAYSKALKQAKSTANANSQSLGELPPD